VNVPPPMDRAPGEEESALAVWSPHASPEPVRLERKPPAPSQPPALAYAARGGKLRPGDPPLNVNRAGYEELQKLPGIGKVLAGNILEERRRRPFASVEDLLRVKGI